METIGEGSEHRSQDELLRCHGRQLRYGKLFFSRKPTKPWKPRKPEKPRKPRKPCKKAKETTEAIEAKEARKPQRQGQGT